MIAINAKAVTKIQLVDYSSFLFLHDYSSKIFVSNFLLQFYYDFLYEVQEAVIF